MTGIPITYSSDRKQAREAGLTWGLLLAVESFAFSILAVALIPSLWLKIAAITTLAGGSGLVLARIVLAPLWTHHLLMPDALIVRYGRDMLTIPRSQISSIESVSERLPSGYQSGFSTDIANRRIVAALSTSHQLLIRLDPPLETTIASASFLAHDVLINADHPDLLLGFVESDDRPDIAVPDMLLNRPNQPTRLRASRQHSGDGITCVEVTKRFGSHLAVNSLTLSVAPGEIYGLLGPNGAGKSTAIAMLAGIAAPDSGIVRLAGYDLRHEGLEARRTLGYVPDRPILYDTLTGHEFLSYIAQLHALPHPTDTIGRLIEDLDFEDHAGKLCRTYSFGTRSKVAVAAALLHDPQVLVLDEPFNGLDPQSSHVVRNMLEVRANAGAAILLSTHDLAIAEALCDRIGFLVDGRLVMEGDLSFLTENGTVPLEARFRSLTHPVKQHVYLGAERTR